MFDRRKIYNEYIDLWEKIEALNKAAEAAVEAGNLIFETHKHKGELAYELADDKWELSEDYFGQANKLLPKTKELLDSLQQNLDCSQYESCAMIGFAKKLKVKVLFLNGNEVIGHIYPVESDYCGSPYFLIVEDTKEILYMDNFWEIDTIEMVVN